jgi:hypothetical protein
VLNPSDRQDRDAAARPLAAGSPGVPSRAIRLALIGLAAGAAAANAQAAGARTSGFRLRPVASGQLSSTLVQATPGAGGEIFGVAERPQQLVRIVRRGATLQLQPQTLPATLLYPASAHYDGRALQVLDLGGPAVHRLRAGATTSELGSLDVGKAVDFCLMRGRTYVYRPGETALVAVYSPADRLVGAFGTQFGSGPPIRREATSRARLVCDPDGGRVLVVTRFTGEVRAYSAEGRLLWTRPVPGVRPIVFVTSGERQVTFMSAPGGSHTLVGASLPGRGRLLVQYGLPRPEHAGEYLSVETHVLSLADGADLVYQRDLPVLVAAGPDLAFTMSQPDGRLVLNRLVPAGR